MADELAQKFLDTRHLWGSLARDLVLAVTPQPLGVTLKIDDILETYGFSTNELLSLMGHPPFRKLLKAETDRVQQLGPRGGMVLRFESMLSSVGESLFARFSNAGNTEATKDMLGFFKLLMQSVGVGQETVAPISNTNQTVVQFTIPDLENPKLAHLKPKLVEGNSCD